MKLDVILSDFGVETSVHTTYSAYFILLYLYLLYSIFRLNHKSGIKYPPYI